MRLSIDSCSKIPFTLFITLLTYFNIFVNIFFVFIQIEGTLLILHGASNPVLVRSLYSSIKLAYL